MEAITMKATVLTQYGSPDYLQVREVSKPIPKDNEVLVKVVATTVTAADSMMRRANPWISRLFLGFFKPRKDITGTGFAGKVEAIGKSVSNFAVGDEVFGESGVNFGANAEFVAVAEDGVIMQKPVTLSFEEAATLCDGPMTSYNFLKNLGKIQPGHKVLIIGASGSLGTAAVQIAKYFGAEVTGVCSGKNAEMVLNLGANAVIDYTQTDFTQNGQQYDLIYDSIGKHSFGKCKKSLTKKGVYLSPVLKFGMLLDMLITSFSKNKKAVFSATGLMPAPELKVFMEEILDLIAQRKLKTIIDQRYPIEEISEAHRYVDTGHKKGNLVILI